MFVYNETGDCVGVARVRHLLMQLRNCDPVANERDKGYEQLLEELRTFSLEHPDDWILVGGERTILKLMDKTPDDGLRAALAAFAASSVSALSATTPEPPKGEIDSDVAGAREGPRLCRSDELTPVPGSERVRLTEATGEVRVAIWSPPGEILCVQEARSDHTALLGEKVWGGGLCMALALAAQPSLVEGLHVLELGSGIGITGLVVAAMGSARTVTLSDYHPALLAALTRSVEANSSAFGSAGCR